MVKVSTRCLEALEIIRKHPSLGAKRFAELFWVDSNMHRKVSNQGHGATAGKAAWLCAGSYIGKLKNRGLVKDVRWDKYGNIIYHSSYELTQEGLEVLNQ